MLWGGQPEIVALASSLEKTVARPASYHPLTRLLQVEVYSASAPPLVVGNGPGPPLRIS